MINKNIIIVTNLHLWSLDSGKGGKAFYHTVNGYLKYGWNVWIITSGGGIPIDLKKRIHVIETSFIRLDGLINSSVRILSVFAKFWKTRMMTAFFESKARQVISQNSGERFVIYGYEVEGVKAAKKVSKKYKMPLVTRFQGTVLANIENTLFNRMRKRPHFSALSTDADICYMTNDGTQGLEVLHRLGNQSKKIFFWRNGVDKIEINKKSKRSEIRSKENLKDEFVFITVSRLVGWKRVNLAIEGFSKVLNQYPKSKLIIIGDGPELRKLIDLSQKLGISDKIVFLGAIEQQQVKNYLVATDAFLSFYDLSNLGNPIMEAMMTGMPIITIDVGATKELVVDGYNGILIPNDELYKIPEMMSLVIKDKSYAKELANGAMKTAKKEFWSWESRIKAEVLETTILLNL